MRLRIIVNRKWLRCYDNKVINFNFENYFHAEIARADKFYLRNLESNPSLFIIKWLHFQIWCNFWENRCWIRDMSRPKFSVARVSGSISAEYAKYYPIWNTSAHLRILMQPFIRFFLSFCDAKTLHGLISCNADFHARFWRFPPRSTSNARILYNNPNWEERIAFL